MIKKITLVILSVLVLTACSTQSGSDDDKVIKIASHMEPMTTVVEIAMKELEKEGYKPELVAVSDNVAANIALNNKEIDANFFQHVPYMTQFNEGNQGTLVGIQPIYDARVGFYSKNYTNLKDLPQDAKIAIPNDGVNQARALLMLHEANVIELEKVDFNVNLKDVKETTLRFMEVDLLTLTHAYEEVDLVFNYPTYIKEVGLTPNDALLLEGDNAGYYAISLVAREDNKDSDKIRALQKAMTSEAVTEFLTNKENSITLRPAY